MDEEATIASLALHVVVSPILDQVKRPFVMIREVYVRKTFFPTQIEQKNLAAGQTLRSAFYKVDLKLRILFIIRIDRLLCVT